MSQSLYLQPRFLSYGVIADKAIADGIARPLAPPSHSAFSHCALIMTNNESERTGARGRTLIDDAPVVAWQDVGETLHKKYGKAKQREGEKLLDALTAKRASSLFNLNAELSYPLIMGIVNMTPDSFSDGGLYQDTDKAIEHALKLVQHGAHLIDIGGESTRPHAERVDSQTEQKRIFPALTKIAQHNIVISIDSRNASTIEKALSSGASIINDVSALTHDPESLSVACRNDQASVILMHMQGTPQTMQDHPYYDCVALDVYDYLKQRIDTCLRAGIDKKRLWVDVGIGFGKNLEHNQVLLRHLSLFHGLHVPLVLGVSRKRLISSLDQECPPDKRIAGSLAAHLHAAHQACHMVRCHDVEEMRQAFAVWRGMMT